MPQARMAALGPVPKVALGLRFKLSASESILRARGPLGAVGGAFPKFMFEAWAYVTGDRTGVVGDIDAIDLVVPPAPAFQTSLGLVMIVLCELALLLPS